MRIWQKIRTSTLSWHCHAEEYAALVLTGAYEEAGDQGRFKVSAGDVVFHEPFEAHLDRFCREGATVLNLRLPVGYGDSVGIGCVTDPDRIARVAEQSHQNAVELLLSSTMRLAPQLGDWPDELAGTLIRNPSLRLCRWAEENGLAPWLMSRGFAQVFGISPEAFRARARARRALKRIQGTNQSLASIAAELGFADQSHMTRSVKHLSGAAPRTWRSAANGFKTGSQVDM